MAFRSVRVTWYVVTLTALVLVLTVPVPALAHARLRPALFALSPDNFPAGSQVVRAGVESNHRLLLDQAQHFGLPPGVLGRRTGYYMDAVEGDQTAAARTYTSYLVSIFRSARQAQIAYDGCFDTWFAANYYTSPATPPIRLGDDGAEALFQTLDPSLPPESEFFFRRGAILVEVFQGTPAGAPTAQQLHSFYKIARKLNVLAAPPASPARSRGSIQIGCSTKGPSMKRHVFVSIVAIAILSLLTPLARVSASIARVSGGWSMVPSMPAPLMSHQAVLLHDGRVLVLGGESVLGVPTRTAQVYDPATHVWTTLTGMHTARIGFTATVLLDGRVLVVGGIGTTMNDLASAELFDPRNERWSQFPALSQSRFSQSASLLPDGHVLLVGGIVQHVISRSTLLFDPQLGAFVSGPSTHSPHAQQGALTVKGGNVLIAGGYGGEPELFNSRSNSWRLAGVTAPRIRPVITDMANGSVLLAGGTDRREQDLRTASVFHPDDNRWTETGPLHMRRNSGVGGLLPNGQVLVAGGEQVDQHLLKTAELYDPTVRSWTMAAPMHVARSGATSTLLSDGTLLVCGGGGFAGAISSCEVYHS